MDTDEKIIKAFYEEIILDKEWPRHLDKYKPHDLTINEDVKVAVKKYLIWSKGNKGSSELIALCRTSDQVPKTIKTVLTTIKYEVEKPHSETENSTE